MGLNPCEHAYLPRVLFFLGGAFSTGRCSRYQLRQPVLVLFFLVVKICRSAKKKYRIKSQTKFKVIKANNIINLVLTVAMHRHYASVLLKKAIGVRSKLDLLGVDQEDKTSTKSFAIEKQRCCRLCA